MGKRVRHHSTLTLLLQAIITDGVGRVQGLFDVTRFQPVQALLRMVGPDAGQAVSL